MALVFHFQQRSGVDVMAKDKDENSEDKPVDKRIGNQFWKARAKHGRDKIFETEIVLWEAACEYFDWVEANPLYEDKVFAYQGEIKHEPAAKMRAMTLDGLYIFLDINRSTWDLYRKRDDFIAVITRIENIIRTQKFEGASADLLNANIIARDLGLRDNVNNEHSGPNGGPIETESKIKVYIPDNGRD